MNEKFVKVEVFVDTTNPEQLGALGAFLSTVGGVTVPIPVKKPNGATADFIPPKPNSDPAPVEPEDPKPTRKRSSKPAASPEPEKPAEPEKKETPEAPKKEYTVEEVREKLKEKVSEHREEIKAKLTELGAPNVSSLNPDKYVEFVDFLEGLE